jgi:hypothetical protein
VHRLAVVAAVRLFDEVGLRGDTSLPRLRQDPTRVAYLLVRIVESHLFAHLAGTRPDLDLAEETLRALLVRACVPHQSRVTRLMDTAMCLVWTSMPETVAESRVLFSALSGV